MARIAILLEDKFEDSEFLKPFKAFRDKGHETLIIGTGLKTVTGLKQNTKVNIEKEIKNTDANDFDALFIPGGYSPDKLRTYDEVLNFVKDFMKKNKPVFVICHGGQVLITANVLKGRTITGYKSIKQDLINAGASFVDDRVVIDNNLISSRNPDDLPYFIEECLKKLD